MQPIIDDVSYILGNLQPLLPDLGKLVIELHHGYPTGKGFPATPCTFLDQAKRRHFVLPLKVRATKQEPWHTSPVRRECCTLVDIFQRYQEDPHFFVELGLRGAFTGNTVFGMVEVQEHDYHELEDVLVKVMKGGSATFLVPEHKTDAKHYMVTVELATPKDMHVCKSTVDEF